MSTHVNRQRVQDRLARLDDEYGIEYREDERVEVEPERFPAEIRLSREGYDGSSYVWIVRPPEAAGPLTESMPDNAGNDRPRVLMILGRGGDEWGIPGGGREGDETFEEGARREVAEETDIECRTTDLFGVRHERRTAPGFDEVLHTLRVVFEGQYEAGHIAIQPGELDGGPGCPGDLVTFTPSPVQSPRSGSRTDTESLAPIPSYISVFLSR